jgi:hypothetical protein
MLLKPAICSAWGYLAAFYCRRSLKRALQKITDQPGDLIRLLIGGKVAGIEDMDPGLRQVALVSGRLGNQE